MNISTREQNPKQSIQGLEALDHTITTKSQTLAQKQSCVRCLSYHSMRTTRWNEWDNMTYKSVANSNKSKNWGITC